MTEYSTITELWGKISEVGSAIIEKKEKVVTPQLAAATCADIANEEQEHCIVLTLDSASKVINKHFVHKGTVNQSMVHPRDVFRNAIKDNAMGIIVIHNHPSGSLSPSTLDSDIAKRLSDACELLGFKMVDFIIVSSKGYYSFNEMGEI